MGGYCSVSAIIAPLGGIVLVIGANCHWFHSQLIALPTSDRAGLRPLTDSWRARRPTLLNSVLDEQKRPDQVVFVFL
jgi:hypothetical protein